MKRFSGLQILLFLFLNSVFTGNSFSQCINTFPNTEDFENAPSWVSGGVNSDWAWGTPAKSVITGAGGGNNCWIIGGLSNPGYNGSQQSFIESPCYDLSTLSYPVVSFKIFWEMEFKYDGAGLQYSTNSGASWISVGSYTDQPTCMTQNWYNYGNINYLTSNSKQGWSGNSKSTAGSCQGGSGSLAWVNAKHCLSNLGGQSNVKFRFVFGSGTTCNTFDGFAIDDFTIENKMPSITIFTNTCTQFTGTDTSCVSPSSYLWNFGDPSTGTANTSTLNNASHIFSAPGTYSVTLTTLKGACNFSTTFSKTVSILGSAIASSSNVTCKGGNNGSATASALFGTGAYTFSWTPEGGNGATASSLFAGNYSVTITDANGCTNTSTVDINEPNPLTGPASQTLTACIGDQTHLQVLVSGINDPISYLWSPGSNTTSSIFVSPTVTTVYSVNISVTGTCVLNEQKLFTALVAPKPDISFTASALKGCAPLCIDLSDKSSTPSGTITKTNWSFSNGTYSNLENLNICFSSPGTYTFSHGATNSFGCYNSVNNISITVLPSPEAKFTADKFIINDLEPAVNFKDESSEDVIAREWNFGGLAISSALNPSFSFNGSGDYKVLLTVVNSSGCSSTAEHTIKVFSEFTFFIPNTFTPNGDLLNDVFLPKGTGWQAENYKLEIFNRWGQKIFFTNDPFLGWDAKSSEDNSYVWKAEIMDNNQRLHSYSGQVNVLR